MFRNSARIINGYRRFHVSALAREWNALDLHSPRGHFRADEEPDIPLRERINGFRDVKEHTKMFFQEWYEEFFYKRNIRRLPPEHEEIKIEWNFKKNPEIFQQFLVTSDKAHKKGFSTAFLDLTKRGSMMFHGNLDTTLPKDGAVFRAGFASFALRKKKLAFNRKDYYMDWSKFSHFVIKLRGDGRSYAVALGCPGTMDVEYADVFLYPLYTHGGPYWQYAMIPLSKFILTCNGRIPDRVQRPVTQWKDMVTPVNNISTFGITLMDRNTGPFQLEIEWIGVYKDVTNFEEWAYEEYKTNMML